jgi:MoaA/NifB/PqqE/SkfB family radical SAM enzyme
MCNTWQHPSNQGKEFTPSLINKIPGNLDFINITGGEPFVREDLGSIVDAALKKARRLVISTNGYFTDRIISLVKNFGNRIGIRISLEGLPAANDDLRGLKDGFDRGLRTLLMLHDRGIKDIGFGMTVSDKNAKDMIELYRLANAMGLEFATAVTHNSFYFHKYDNTFSNREMIAGEFERIAYELLKTNKTKNWFRAYFNMGLANKVRGGKRPLPCDVGTDVFFLDPYGNILPCNGSALPLIMGNMHDQAFDEIWHGQRAEEIRKHVKHCEKQCWMIGSVAPAMKKNVKIPALWVIKNKLKIMKSKGTISLNQVSQEVTECRPRKAELRTK